MKETERKLKKMKKSRIQNIIEKNDEEILRTLQNSSAHSEALCILIGILQGTNAVSNA